MLEVTDELIEVLKGSFVTELYVSSWRGDQMLYTRVPVSSGSLTMDRSLNVPERVTLSVPRYADGVSWVPSDIDHPLSPYGQVLQVQLGVGVGKAQEILRLGWFVVTETDTSGDSINVVAEGLLKLIDEAKFTAPFEASGTFTDTVQALVEPALTVVFEGLTDRSVPVGTKWDEDRLAALTEVLDSWPADAEVTEDGYLRVTPPPAPTFGQNVWVINDTRDDGTVVQWATSSTREGAYNVVVARGETSNGDQVQAVVLDQEPTSATYLGGPFNPLPVPYFFYSPLLTSVTQCTAAAQTIMKRKQRARSRSVTVEMVPNPALRLGDVVVVEGTTVGLAAGTIESIMLPLNPGGGAMTMLVNLTVHVPGS